MAVMDGAHTGASMQLARGEGDRSLRRFTFDLFVATPMSAFGEGLAYKANRESLIKFVTRLQRTSRFRRLFCPALDIVEFEDFDGNSAALVSDLAALEASEAFVLFYLSPLPAKPSSVLVEAGAALTRRIPSIYIVRSRSDLPYMLASADSVDAESFENSRRKQKLAAKPSLSSQLPSAPFVKIIEIGGGQDINADEVLEWLNNSSVLADYRV